MTKIIIHEIPPELSISWLVAAVLLDIEDTAAILQIEKVYHQSWSGMGMHLLVKIKQDSINAIPVGLRLHVAVDGKEPKYYICGSDKHLKIEYSTYKEQKATAQWTSQVWEAYSVQQQQQQQEEM